MLNIRLIQAIVVLGHVLHVPVGRAVVQPRGKRLKIPARADGVFAGGRVDSQATDLTGGWTLGEHCELALTPNSAPLTLVVGSSPRGGKIMLATTTPSRAQQRTPPLPLWTLFFAAVQVLFVIWVFAALAYGSGVPSTCGSLSADSCSDAQTASNRIGVSIIVVAWVVVDFLLAVMREVYRLVMRP